MFMDIPIHDFEMTRYLISSEVTEINTVSGVIVVIYYTYKDYWGLTHFNNSTCDNSDIMVWYYSPRYNWL